MHKVPYHIWHSHDWQIDLSSRVQSKYVWWRSSISTPSDINNHHPKLLSTSFTVKFVYEEWDHSDHHVCDSSLQRLVDEVPYVSVRKRKSCLWMWLCSVAHMFFWTRFCTTHDAWHGSSLLRLKSEIGTFEDVGDHVVLSLWRVCLFESLPTQLEYVFTFESGVVIDVILSKWLRFIWKLYLSCVHT